MNGPALADDELAVWTVVIGLVVGFIAWVFLTEKNDYECNESPRIGLGDVLKESRHGALVLPPLMAELVAEKPVDRLEKMKSLGREKKKNQTKVDIESVTPEGCKPLLVFVNSQSGGRQGLALLLKLKRLLHPVQVVDLAKTGPNDALQRYSVFSKLFVLVCGGDGTVGWVLSAMDSLNMRAPVAIMPLGTGNDLARVLGWGAGWEGESVADILAQVATSHVRSLDRWSIKCGDQRHQPLQHWTNYVSVGADAGVALRFHKHRRHKPRVFFSRLVNKFWYMRHGIAAFFNQIKPMTPPCVITDKMVLECDGVKVELPAGTAGVIVSNIESYGGGATGLWGGTSVVDMNDGQLEVVAVTGVLHLTQIQLGLASGIPLAKCSKVSFKTTRSLPMQIDGEPWTQPPCTVDISFSGTAAMLSRTRGIQDEVLLRITDVLEWAEQKGHITPDQLSVILNEACSRKAHS